jgi:hypothetical protein
MLTKQGEFDRCEEILAPSTFRLSLLIDQLIFGENRLQAAREVLSRHSNLHEALSQKAQVALAGTERLTEAVPTLIRRLDRFDHAMSKTTSQSSKYISLEDYGFAVGKNVFWMKRDGCEPEEGIKKLIECTKKRRLWGIDTESTIPLEEDQKAELSLVQIACQDAIFLFDILGKPTRFDREVAGCVQEILENPKALKLYCGRSKGEEAKYMALMGVEAVKPRSVIEMQDVYGKIHPEHKRTGLVAQVAEALDRKICKREQLSQWKQRPLRLSQLHYAALDAYVLILIFEAHLKKIGDEKLLQILESFLPKEQVSS